MNPRDDLTLEEFSAASGFTPEQILQARSNGELFSVRKNDESFGRYPAYQLLDDIAGQALRALIFALGADGGPDLYMFMSDVGSGVFGGADAVEILCGRLFRDRPLEEGVAEYLKQDPFSRFRAVIKVAKGWNWDEDPNDESQLEDRMRRKVSVGVLSAVPWFTRRQLEAKVGRETLEGWSSRHEMFSLPSAIGLDLYPSYVFSGDDRPSAVIPEILRWLEYPSGLSVAAWFDSTSSFLDGARPRELIASAPGEVVAAAKDNFENVHYL